MICDSYLVEDETEWRENKMYQGYKSLDVWQKSMCLVREVYSLIRLMPVDERFSLCDQMRRSVVSIPSNIAEGYGRNYKNDFLRFLNIARGSKYEIETQIEICAMLGYFSLQDAQHALSLCDDVGKMINALIKKLQSRPENR